MPTLTPTCAPEKYPVLLEDQAAARFGFPVVLEASGSNLDGFGRFRYRLDVGSGSLRVRATSTDEDELGNRDTFLDAADGLPSSADVGVQGSLEESRKPRGAIVGWSKQSRLNMMYVLSTLDWDGMVGIPEMITLTYGRDFPADGPTVKRHLDNFRRSFEDEFGTKFRGVWKLEFQRRGAPHLHLYIGRPFGDWRKFVAWARATWHRIAYGCTGSNALGRRHSCGENFAHLDQGVRVDRQFISRAKSVKALAWYFTKHNAKHSEKHFQNLVPDGFEAPGRFWGVYGLERDVTELRLTVGDFVKVRRALVAFRRSALGRRPGRRRPKCAGRLIGTWALSNDPSTFAHQLSRLLTDPPDHPRGEVRHGFAAVAPPLPARRLVTV